MPQAHSGYQNMSAAGKHQGHKVSSALAESCLPQLIARSSSRSVDKVYQSLLQRFPNPPTSIDFLYRDRSGSLRSLAVPYEHLRLGDGLSIAPSVMDVTCEVTLRYGPSRVLSTPTVELPHQDAFGWACSNPPPAEWRGLRITPLYAGGLWSLLVEEYRGPDASR